MMSHCLPNTNLHPRRSENVEGGDHSGDEVHDLGEALLADAPGAVDEEHHVCFGAFANCGERTRQVVCPGAENSIDVLRDYWLQAERQTKPCD